MAFNPVNQPGVEQILHRLHTGLLIVDDRDAFLKQGID